MYSNVHVDVHKHKTYQWLTTAGLKEKPEELIIFAQYQKPIYQKSRNYRLHVSSEHPKRYWKITRITRHLLCFI